MLINEMRYKIYLTWTAWNIFIWTNGFGHMTHAVGRQRIPTVASSPFFLGHAARTDIAYMMEWDGMDAMCECKCHSYLVPWLSVSGQTPGSFALFLWLSVSWEYAISRA